MSEVTELVGTAEGTATSARRDAFMGAVVAAMLIAMPILKVGTGTTLPPVIDADVWWHIRTGQWIAEHRAVPEFDPFAWTARDRRFCAYSWGPELVLAGLYEAMGLRGIVLFAGGMGALIVAAIYGLVRRAQRGFLVGGLITLPAALGLCAVLTPRPWLFSILFFVLELQLLLATTRRRRPRMLLWLVPLFVLWANAHIQFVLGLGVLGFAMIESALAPVLAKRWRWAPAECLPLRWTAPIFLACAAATLLNPYGVGLHTTAYAVATQMSGLKDLIKEFLPMSFEGLEHWSVVLLALLAAGAMGRWGPRRLLWLMLYAMSVYLGFRARRDAWVLIAVSTGALAHIAPPLGTPAPMARSSKALATVLSVALVGLALLMVCEQQLRRAVTDRYPQSAIDFIRTNRLPGPLFNSYDWGGYISLQLPEHAVSMDGRGDVHGTERILRHLRTLDGNDWTSDAELGAARLILLQKQAALSQIMRHDPRYRVVYEDGIALVLVLDDQR